MITCILCHPLHQWEKKKKLSSLDVTDRALASQHLLWTISQMDMWNKWIWATIYPMWQVWQETKLAPPAVEKKNLICPLCIWTLKMEGLFLYWMGFASPNIFHRLFPSWSCKINPNRFEKRSIWRVRLCFQRVLPSGPYLLTPPSLSRPFPRTTPIRLSQLGTFISRAQALLLAHAGRSRLLDSHAAMPRLIA